VAATLSGTSYSIHVGAGAQYPVVAALWFDGSGDATPVDPNDTTELNDIVTASDSLYTAASDGGVAPSCPLPPVTQFDFSGGNGGNAFTACTDSIDTVNTWPNRVPDPSYDFIANAAPTVSNSPFAGNHGRFEWDRNSGFKIYHHHLTCNGTTGCTDQIDGWAHLKITWTATFAAANRRHSATIHARLSVDNASGHWVPITGNLNVICYNSTGAPSCPTVTAGSAPEPFELQGIYDSSPPLDITRAMSGSGLNNFEWEATDLSIAGTSYNPYGDPDYTELSGQFRCETWRSYGYGCEYPMVQPQLNYDATRLALSEPNIRRNIQAAIYNGYTNVLTRRYARIYGGCNGFTRAAGMSCDEYPFASTYELKDRPTPCRRSVPPGENSHQGGIISSFYRAFRIIDEYSRRIDADTFKVVVGPGTGVCG
jgi:hypothetical protein